MTAVTVLPEEANHPVYKVAYAIALAMDDPFPAKFALVVLRAYNTGLSQSEQAAGALPKHPPEPDLPL